jgi:uncharacterized membrane protein YczE
MFLSIKKIPVVDWSSKETFNFKPKISTFSYLCFGLMLFGFGEALLVVSTTGNSPWTVLAEGASIITDLSIGVATFFISVGVLSLWFFLKQKPGLGTIMNIIIIAIMLDITINLVGSPSSLISQYFLAILGVFLVGLGSGFYLTANLGPGPRDGLMTGLTKKTNLPIALVRACIEITAVGVGWYLGGTVGVGTLIYAFGIGPCVALGLFIVDKIFN